MHLSILFVQCKSNNSGQVDRCKQNHEKANELVFEFQIQNNISKKTFLLDSALFYIDEVFGNCDLDNMLAIRKLLIFSLKEEYAKGLTFIESVDGSIFEPSYYKVILIERFSAMDAMSQGDSIKMINHLENIVFTIEKYIAENQNEIDSLIRTSSIIDSKYSLVLPQLFYYKSNIQNINDVMKEIDSLHNVKNGNSEYFEIIRSYANSESIMNFNGY